MRYALRNDNRRNRCVVEDVSADSLDGSFTFDGFGDDVFAGKTAGEVRYFDFGIFAERFTEQNAVLREVALIVCVNDYFFKLTSAEYVTEVVYLGSVFAYIYIIEIAYRLGGVFGMERIFFVIHNRANDVEVKRSELGSTSERILFKDFKVFGQSKFFDFTESVESLTHYRKVAVVCLTLKREFGNRAAAHKSFFVDESHVCGDGEFGDFRALERRFADRENSLRNGIFGYSSFREIDYGIKLLGGFVQFAQNAVKTLVVCVVLDEDVLHSAHPSNIVTSISFI